jgi:hypothetical protein
LGKQYRSLSFSLCSFSHPPDTLSLLGPNYICLHWSKTRNSIFWPVFRQRYEVITSRTETRTSGTRLWLSVSVDCECGKSDASCCSSSKNNRKQNQQLFNKHFFILLSRSVSYGV